MTRSYKPRTKSVKICNECGSSFLGEPNSKYCSKLCLSRNEYSANMLKFEWRLRKILAGAKGRSKLSNLDFDIDLEYLIALWKDNEGKCVVSGRSFNLESYGEYGQVNPDAPSIDRIVPKQGYTKGNVRLVTYHVNVALSEYGLDSLIELSQDIIKVRFK